MKQKKTIQEVYLTDDLLIMLLNYFRCD